MDLQLYSTREAGEILGVSGLTVWRWWKAGRITAINLHEGDGRPLLRISADELKRFIDASTLDQSA